MTHREDPPLTTSGFVDGHSHLRSTALVDHGVVGSSLEEAILRMNAMTAVDIEDDVFVATSDLIRLGVTGVQAIVHSFLPPDEYLEMLDAIVRGVRRSGIRALLVLGATDQAEFFPVGCTPLPGMPPFTEPAHRQSPDEMVDIVERAHALFPEQSFGVGPVGAQWCSDALLEALGHLAEKHQLRVHTHLLESPRQRRWAGDDLVDRLARHGLLGPRTSCAHAVWLDERDLGRLSEAGAQLVTCPHSNATLHSGRADIAAWHQADIPYAIGLDSIDPTVSPWSVATQALDDKAALHALTLGGVAATGLTTTDDSVTWRELSSGLVDEVTINGIVRVSDGVLWNQDEVEETRIRIHGHMSEDSLARKKRQGEISAVLADYVELVDRFLA